MSREHMHQGLRWTRYSIAPLVHNRKHDVARWLEIRSNISYHEDLCPWQVTWQITNVVCQPTTGAFWYVPRQDAPARTSV